MCVCVCLTYIRQRYRSYKTVYKEYLHDPLSKSLKNQLRLLENTMDLFNLVMAREQARLEVSAPQHGM